MIASKIIPFGVPFARPTTLGGRTHRVREGCLLSLTKGDVTGWGECAPLPGFSGETLQTAVADLREALSRLATGSILEPESPAASCALDAAFQGLIKGGAGELDRFGWARRPHRATQTINGVLLESESPHRVTRLAGEGYRTVKMKVGGDPRADAVRVRKVAEASMALRLDANRGWSLTQARVFFEALGGIDIEYIEEPTASLGDSRQLALDGIPVALDESLTGLTLAEIESLDWPVALVLKPMILGGLRRSRSIAETALSVGITPVISSAIETDVGLRALALFAASIGDVDVTAGLGTARLLGASTTAPAFEGRHLVRVGEPFRVEVP